LTILGWGKTTFAVGHLALGYLTGKASARLLNIEANVPLLLTLSILPDIDMLILMLPHGGPTHSIILYLALALPAILIWKKQTIPYLIAIVSHPLLGDYPTRIHQTSGVQLFYPLTSEWFAAGIQGAMIFYVYVELILFAVFLSIVLSTKDLSALIRPHSSNWLLGIPIATALLPVFLRFPLSVPAELVIPHIVLIALLGIPVLIDLKSLLAEFLRDARKYRVFVSRNQD
jgi:hypothetical protein